MTCCDSFQWTPLWDLGSTDSFDFDLGRCAACGKYVMSVWRTGVSTYVPLTSQDADRLVQAHGPELKKVLKEWFNRPGVFWE